MNSFRVETPHPEIANLLIDLAKKAGFIYGINNHNPVYFHYIDGYFHLYNHWWLKSSDKSFIPLNDAITFLKQPHLPKIGEYRPFLNLDKNILYIGCQTISKEKVKEILDVLNF